MRRPVCTPSATTHACHSGVPYSGLPCCSYNAVAAWTSAPPGGGGGNTRPDFLLTIGAGLAPGCTTCFERSSALRPVFLAMTVEKVTVSVSTIEYQCDTIIVAPMPSAAGRPEREPASGIPLTFPLIRPAALRPGGVVRPRARPPRGQWRSSLRAPAGSRRSGEEDGRHVEGDDQCQHELDPGTAL